MSNVPLRSFGLRATKFRLGRWCAFFLLLVTALACGSPETAMAPESDATNVTPYNEQFSRQVEAADEFMRKYRDVLRELAK